MAVRFLHRREHVVLTAIDIINELGVQGLSTRELAKREGVSEGTLFRHFQNKNAMIVATLDYAARFDDDIFATVLSEESKSVEAIIKFYDLYVTCYEGFPAILALAQLCTMEGNPEVENKVKEIRSNRRGVLKALIERGQEAGELAAMIDSERLVDIIAGSFQMICCKWRAGGRTFALKEYALATIRLILQAFSAETFTAEGIV